MRSLNSENFERNSPPKTESVIPAAKKMKFENAARSFSKPMQQFSAPFCEFDYIRSSSDLTNFILVKFRINHLLTSSGKLINILFT